MALTLHYHPLSSFCWKVLVGLYENDIAFAPLLVNPGDAASREAFVALAPLGKFPVLQDHDRGEVVPESSVILDYLDLYYPGPVRFVPADPEAAWRTRLWDRLLDLHVHEQMQTVVGDRLRPAESKDPFGVAQARARITTAYGLVEQETAKREWLSAHGFGLADCAALPALYYADKVQPLGSDYPATAAYLARLAARPSVARVLQEAAPYFKFFPQA